MASPAQHPSPALRPITYVASYPRSGNTYFRALLANYFSASDQPLTPNEVAFFGAGENNEKLWRSCTGLGHRARTIELNWNARPDYLDLVRHTPGDGPLFLKTHTLNGRVFDKPAFAFEPTDRIIYLVRHPLDVAISGADFFKLDLEAMADRLLLSGAFNSMDGGYHEITGSWTEHVSGWVTEEACPVLLVKFEQLVTDPMGELIRALDFVGAPLSKPRLERAVRHTAFKALQAAQARHGFDQGPGRDPTEPFFRVGQAGQWRTHMSAPLIERLGAAMGDHMAAFGYVWR